MDHGSDSLLFRLYSVERVQVEVDVPGRSVPIETSFLGASKGNPPDIGARIETQSLSWNIFRHI